MKGILRGNLSKKKIQKIKKEKTKKEENISRIQKISNKKQKKKYKKQFRKEKVKANDKISDISRRKRLRFGIIFASMIFLSFIGRIGWLQFVMGEELQSMAYVQQTLDRKINPRRGTIYDATGKNILAVSSTVNTITVNPVNIAKSDKEKVARALSDIFALDYEKILKKVSKKSAIETIIKKVDKEKADELRIWLSENHITSGVNIDEDTKRYYPNNNLASQVIGFSRSR